MKAVARLMLAYLAGTPLARAFCGLGVLAAGGGAAALLYLPPLVGGQGLPSQYSLAQEAFFAFLAPAGAICLVFGASLMPSLFTALVTGHYAYVLPYGRVKLVASVLATIALFALVTAATVLAYYVGTPAPLDLVFERVFVVALPTYSVLYVVLWFTARSRTAAHVLAGVALMIATLAVPLRYIATPSAPLRGPAIACALLWASFAAVTLLAPRLRAPLGRLRRALAARAPGVAYSGRSEIDFLIGTANPLPLALGQVVPIVLAAYLLRGYAHASPSATSPWLFFVTILSVLSGAVASLAASRSRALWLRIACARAELFARVEAAFWRYNCFTLGVLIVTLAVVGSYYALPPRTLAFGMVLVALGTALSTYLGLMVTAPISFGLALAAIGTMLALMIAAIQTAQPATPAATLGAIAASLGAGALLYRQAARARWRDLDWMLCRAERSPRASG